MGQRQVAARSQVGKLGFERSETSNPVQSAAAQVAGVHFIHCSKFSIEMKTSNHNSFTPKSLGEIWLTPESLEWFYASHHPTRGQTNPL